MLHEPYLTQLTAIEKSLQLSNLAVKHGCDPNLTSFPGQTNVIHAFITGFNHAFADAGSYRLHNCVQLPINKFREIFSCMVGMGCELEGRDAYGHTVLFWACLLWQSDMIMALIDIGANTNATDDTGNSVLHCSLTVNGIIQRDYGSLHRGLVFLLSQKVDPNHLNDAGLSPSDHACMSLTMLDTWAKAVKHAGYETLWIKRKHIDCGHDEKILIVVSAGFELSGNSTLPISDITLDEWKEKRKRLGCQMSQFNESRVEAERI